jgi:hypothetical protein
MQFPQILHSRMDMPLGLPRAGAAHRELPRALALFHLIKDGSTDVPPSFPMTISKTVDSMPAQGTRTRTRGGSPETLHEERIEGGGGGRVASAPGPLDQAHSGPPAALAGPEGQQAPDATHAARKATTAAAASTARAGLRNAAQWALSAWDGKASQRTDLPDAMAALRGLLAKPAPADRSAGPRKPREATKHQQVLAMLRRSEGATVAQITEATGWQAHTVRGFFAGLKKRHGIAVEAAERVRQVGPGKEGAKGSYSVYRIAEAG